MAGNVAPAGFSVEEPLPSDEGADMVEAEAALSEFLNQGWINESTLIIIEEDKMNKLEIPKGFLLQEKRSAGRNTFYFLKKGE